MAEEIELQSDVVASNATVAPVRRKRKKEVSFRLTSRDYEILSFLLDQKFAEKFQEVVDLKKEA